MVQFMAKVSEVLSGSSEIQSAGSLLALACAACSVHTVMRLL